MGSRLARVTPQPQLLRVWRAKVQATRNLMTMLQTYKLLINLILVAMQTRHVTLEDAANVLIGEEEEGQTKYKSKKLTT